MNPIANRLIGVITNPATSVFGIGYIACKVAALVFPVAAPVCGLLDDLFITGGLLVAADGKAIPDSK